MGDYFKAREYLSGFTGSAGTLVVLPDSAALWTDGRYFLQAADQLAGSTIDLMRAGQPGVPTIGAFLAQRVPQGGTVGFDGRTVSSLFARTMAAALEGKNVRFAYEQDLAGAVWPDRPALSAQPVWELPAECAGLTREEKLHLLREKMRETGAEVLVLTALDEVAWTLNLRGDDVRCTPVFLSFLLLRQEEATLCVQEQILSGELKEKLVACGVALAPYESIYDRLRAIPAGTAVQTDSATANYCVLQSLSGAKVLDRPSPVQLMKAMKTPAAVSYTHLDVYKRQSPATVALHVKPDDACILREECNGRHALERDLADLHLGVGLTMTLPFAVTLLGGVLEDTDLLALAVLHHGGVHLGTLHHGSTELGVLAVHDGQHLIKDHGVAGVDVQLLDEKRITLGNVVLLTTGHDNCLHYLLHLPFLYNGLAVGGVGCGSRNFYPFKAAYKVYQPGATLSTPFGGILRHFLRNIQKNVMTFSVQWGTMNKNKCLEEISLEKAL